MDKEKLEDVKEGLRCCIDNDCAGCPYITLCLDEGRQFAALAKDALEIITSSVTLRATPSPQGEGIHKEEA